MWILFGDSPKSGVFLPPEFPSSEATIPTTLISALTLPAYDYVDEIGFSVDVVKGNDWGSRTRSMR